ncbi:biotin/lipoyl-binding protein [Pseudomonas syringae pv. actinidiae]|nr:biotin/lipoyl-binding protein [Pseudomonas syringae pv. actinidiae]
MEKVIKITGIGAESYGVKAVHVFTGKKISVGDVLVTIASSNTSIDICAEQDGNVVAILVCPGDRVKAGNDILLVTGQGRTDFLDRVAVGY